MVVENGAGPVTFEVLMKKFLLAAFCCTLLSVQGAEEAAPAPEPVAEVAAETVLADRPEMWFPVGETLLYTMSWGFIPVGSSRVTSEWIDFEGKERIRIQMRSKSNSVIEKLYPVDDLMETIVDPATFTPVQFHKKLSEGRYRADETTRFDYDKMLATFTANMTGKTKEYPIEKDSRDLLAFMFFMRSVTVDPDQQEEITYRVMADEKLYDMHVPPPKLEKVKLKKYGKIPSYRYKPRASFQGLFVRKGDMDLWVSNDARQIITKMLVDTPFANVKIYLKEVTGPGDDKWIKKKPKSGTDDGGEAVGW